VTLAESLDLPHRRIAAFFGPGSPTFTLVPSAPLDAQGGWHLFIPALPVLTARTK